MNLWIQFAGTLVAQIVVAVFIYGQIVQKVKDLTSWSKEHNEQLHVHTDQLMNHEGRISHIEGRKGVPHGGD